MAKVLAINISEKKGIPKTPTDTAEVRVDYGIVGDAHAGDWHRQISLLANESIDKVREMGVKDLDFGRFAENITTEGIVLHTLDIGTVIEIGNTSYEVTQIGKECHSHCAIYHQVGDCVMPREGIFVKVIKPGVIKPGDDIKVKE